MKDTSTFYAVKVLSKTFIRKVGALHRGYDFVGREGSGSDGGTRCSYQNGSPFHYEAALLLSSGIFSVSVPFRIRRRYIL